MIAAIRLTGRQHNQLQAHLYPGDGKEAVAVALCGRYKGEDCHNISVYKIEYIPYDECAERSADRVCWPTSQVEPLIEEAARKNMAVLKIHSHPGGFNRFSPVDDASDRELFRSVYGVTDTEERHASAVMLPDGSLFARTVRPDGCFEPVPLVSVAGDNLSFWRSENLPAAAVPGAAPDEFASKNKQFFGEETFQKLQSLNIAVVGCSGTGSPVIEQLARLGVGRLVLVDPDVVKVKNLNRIFNTTREDADDGLFKVDVMARAVAAMGLSTTVLPIRQSLIDPEVIRTVAGCDVIFGCMDSAEGRYYLNRLAVFYSIPYFDLGVRLDADGDGGVNRVCGSVHYLQPDGSSLLSRGVITQEEVRAEGMARETPEEYERQRYEGYIRNVHVERPAVISINVLIAAMALNEFLARLHAYRLVDNRDFAVQGIDLINDDHMRDSDGDPCPSFARYAGRGDMKVLIGVPTLSTQAGVL